MTRPAEPLRRRKPAWALASLLILAACAGGAVPEATPAPASPDAGQPSDPSIAALPSGPAPAAPPSEAERLIGLRGELLRAWLGDTVFVRRDGIAEIWRFAGDGCFLDVFLYRERDGLRVAHLDARPRAGNQRITPQSCYGRILASRHAAPAS